MSRMVLYLARTLEPPPVNAWVQVYGLTGDATAITARVSHIDAAGITVEVDTDVFGCRIWHFDLPQVQ